MQNNRKVVCSITLSINALDQLDEFLKKNHMSSRSAYIESLVLNALNKKQPILGEKGSLWTKNEKEKLKLEFFKVLRGIGRKYPVDSQDAHIRKD